MALDLSDRAQLRQYFDRRFNLDELKDLVFDLDDDPELIANNKREFPRELINYFERQSKLDLLIRQALAQRPDDQIAKLLTKVPPSETVTAAEKPGIWVGVPAMPVHFVGRDELIQELIQRLTSGESLALSAEGKPGVGKTTLAVALAHRREVLDHFQDGVLWAGLGLEADVLSTLNTWASALGIDVSGLVDEAARQQAVRDAIGQRRLLLVIDDAWDIQAAARLRCGGPNCCHLLTTRDKGIGRQFAGLEGMQSVPPLADDPAFALLQRLAPEACAADPQAAQALAQSVGGLPLALELLGGYLALPRRSLLPKLSKAALVKMMDPQQRLQLAEERLGAPGKEVTLQDTILLSLDGLGELEQGAEAERAFYALAAFAPKPEGFSWEAAEVVTEVDAEILALLVEGNLLEATDDQLALHQTLADVARTGLDEAAVARHCNYYLNLVNSDQRDWRGIERVYGQMKWAWRGVEDKQMLDYVEAVRQFQQLRGLWRDYIEWAERGLLLARAKALRVEQGVLLGNIAMAYSSLGQPLEALEYYDKAFSIQKEMGDGDRLASTLNNIGYVYYRLEPPQLDRALEYFALSESILGRRLEQGGRLEQRDDWLRLAATFSNIGLVYDGLEQSEKALDYYHRALSIQHELEDQSGLATTLNNIGGVFHNLGQPGTAIDYYKQALPIKKAEGDLYGLAATLHNIGSAYRDLGQWKEASDFLHQRVSIQEKLDDQASLAAALLELAWVYSKLEQREKALDHLNRALPIVQGLGDQHGERRVLYNRAMIYWWEGQFWETGEDLKRVVELDRLVQSPNLERDVALLAEVEAELAAQGAAG
jgi:tetratricopeptide (TPR) repeat protein